MQAQVVYSKANPRPCSFTTCACCPENCIGESGPCCRDCRYLSSNRDSRIEEDKRAARSLAIREANAKRVSPMVLTREQRRAVHLLYTRNPDGSESYRAFRRRVLPMFLGYGAVALDPWCRMYVGIETDGHTHS
jgi:hypothetical protein